VDSKARVKAALLATVAVACALRLVGLNFHLPYVYHADELQNYTITSRIINSGGINPDFFNYPSSFFYSHALVQLATFEFAKAFGSNVSLSEFTQVGALTVAVGYVPEPLSLLASRLLTAFLGALTVLFLYLSVRVLLDDEHFALLCAALLALYPPHVEHSHFMTPDVGLAFGCVLALWGAVLVLKRGNPAGYLAAAIGAGVAASFKYTGALILLAPATAHFARLGVKEAFKDVKLYITPLAALALFASVNPLVIKHPQLYWGGIKYVQKYYGGGHPGMEGEPAKWYLSRILLTLGPLALAAFASPLWLKRRWRELAVVFSFALPYFAAISLAQVRNMRTLLVLIPFLLVMATVCAKEMWRSPGRWRKPSQATAIATIALSVLLFAYRDIGKIGSFVKPDSREAAQRWIYENIPQGATIALEAYTPYLDPNRYELRPEHALLKHTPRYYESSGVDYLIFCSIMYERYMDNSRRYPAEAKRYRELFDRFELAEQFSDGDVVIKILKARRNPPPLNNNP